MPDATLQRDVPWATTELEVLVRDLLKLIGTVTGLDSTYLTHINWDANAQRILFAHNSGALDIPEGVTVDWHDTLCRRALEAGVDRTVDAATDLPGSVAAADLGITSYVTVPVTDEDGTILGTVCGASDSIVPVGDDVMQILRTLASMVSLQVRADVATQALAAANAKLEQMAYLDVLTGIPNRRAFDDALARACGDASRRNEPVALISVDVNKFKQVNDTFGHAAGDEVLRAVATGLTVHTRTADTAARVGGDEFIVILPGTDLASAQRIAVRIAEDVNATVVDTDCGPVPVSVSVGVASGTGVTPERLLRDSDTAMYATKFGASSAATGA